MYRKRLFLFFMQAALCAGVTSTANAQDGWRDEMQYIRYAPRYFGPNAFPIPDLRSGKIDARPEIELRGEYQVCAGDRTKDVFARLFIPVAKGLAGVEISGVVYEYYDMTPETVAERHAAGVSWPDGARGDVVVTSFYQLLRNEKWADITVEATLKTASGDRLADARYTDAAAYWFLLNAGRDLYRNDEAKVRLRLQGLLGFYCWMTNDPVHRQNDAPVYAAGVGVACRRFVFDADFAGIHGYKNNGDRPMQLRAKLNCELGKNIISLRFRRGLKDSLYDTVSIAFVRRL